MNVTFQDVLKMARENNLTVILKDSGYSLCDENLQTLVTTSNLQKMAWYINNCEILGIVKV